MEKRKFLPSPGLELRPLGRPARSQSVDYTYIYLCPKYFYQKDERALPGNLSEASHYIRYDLSFLCLSDGLGDVVYLATLSVTRLVNNEMERMWEQAFVASFALLSELFAGRTGHDNHSQE
jgi:hypothetical protein